MLCASLSFRTFSSYPCVNWLNQLSELYVENSSSTDKYDVDIFFQNFVEKNIHDKTVQFFTIQFLLLKTLRKRALKILWEKKKILMTGIFTFSHNVSNPFTKKKKKKNAILVTFELSSANSLNLKKPNILSFAKELKSLSKVLCMYKTCLFRNR